MFCQQSSFRIKSNVIRLGGVLFAVLGIGWIGVVCHHQMLNRRLVDAVRRKDAKAVTELITQGADPNARTGTPVFLGYLLRFMATGRPSEAGSGEPALLLIGVERNYNNTIAEDTICTTLLQSGASPTVRDSAGLTILFYAARLHLHRTVQLLLSQGANPNERLSEGVSPLLVADTTDTLALLQHGADVSITDSSGFTALHHACKERDPHKVHILLSRHANVEAKTSGGFTPLMYASDPMTCQLLLEHGASVNARNVAGAAALMLAQDPKVIQLLLDHGANVDIRDQDGFTALTRMSCSDKCNPEAIKLLLQHRAHIDDHFSSGWSALHYACYNSNVPLARFLLDHGANIDAQASGGLTPLMCSREPNIALLLLSRGAQINVRDDYGRTDLDCEIDLLNQQRDWRAVQMIPLLKQHGAVP